MNKTRKLLRNAMWGASLGGLATILVTVFTVTPQTLDGLAGMKWGFIPLIFLMVVTAWLCNGLRTWTLSRALGNPLTLRQALAISLSTEFGIAASPAGMGGGLVRITLMRRAGFRVNQIASLMAADLSVDAVFFSTLFLFTVASFSREMAGQISALELSVPAVGPTAIAAACFLGPGAYFFLNGGWLKAFGGTNLGKRLRVTARWRLAKQRIKRELVTSGVHIRFLYRHRRKALALNLSLGTVQWLCRYGILPVILLAFSTPANMIPLLFLQGFLFALSLLLVLPGGGGGVEVTTAVILQYFVPAPNIGVVLILWRFFTYHLYLIVCGAAFADTFGHLDRIFPRPLD